MITLATANHKGGVGKTATTHAIGAGLAQLGYRVLLVDIDPQASLTQACGVSPNGESLAEVLGGALPGTMDVADVLVDVSDIPDTTLHLAPADIALSVNELGLVQRMGRENLLHNALEEVAGRYDVCVIDCPPSLGILTVNALRAAAAVIVPTQPQISDLRGLKLFLDTIEQIKKEINTDLILMGVLVTFYDGRLIHHQDAVGVLRDQGLPMFETMIGRSVRVAESPAAGESIITYDPKNPQADNYQKLSQEVDTWLRNERR